MPELVVQWEWGVLMEQQRGGLLQSGKRGPRFLTTNMSLHSNRGQKTANNLEDTNEDLSALSLGIGGLLVEPPSLF